jgi:phosphatidylserine/phosphatidylglycerophosphate/cardiolipin synthase-like enzyme
MVRHRSGLHAKVAITDTDLVVGSSNASAAGLGFNELSAETLIEAGALLSDARSRSDAASWFENEWERGTALDDKILATAGLVRGNHGSPPGTDRRRPYHENSGRPNSSMRSRYWTNRKA